MAFALAPKLIPIPNGRGTKPHRKKRQFQYVEISDEENSPARGMRARQLVRRNFDMDNSNCVSTESTIVLQEQRGQLPISDGR